MSVRVWHTVFLTSVKMFILVSRSPAELYLWTKSNIGFGVKTTCGVVASSSKKRMPLEYLMLRHPYQGVIMGNPKGGSGGGGWAMIVISTISTNKKSIFQKKCMPTSFPKNIR